MARIRRCARHASAGSAENIMNTDVTMAQADEHARPDRPIQKLGLVGDGGVVHLPCTLEIQLGGSRKTLFMFPLPLSLMVKSGQKLVFGSKEIARFRDRGLINAVLRAQ